MNDKVNDESCKRSWTETSIKRNDKEPNDIKRISLREVKYRFLI